MSLSLRVLNGSIWSFTLSLINRSLGLISTIILIRYLSPQDFGIAALATMVMLLFMSLCELGIRQYIIKTADISDDMINSAWSLQLLINIVIGLLIIVLSTFLANLLESPPLNDVLKVVAFIPIIAALNNPGGTLAEKKLDYATLSKVTITSKLISAPLAVFIAIQYQTYWALIAGQLLSIVIVCILSYVFFDYRPKFNSAHFSKVFSATKWLLASTMTGFVRAKAETVIVNAKFGTESLGYYDTSKEFACLPLQDIISPASAPLLAGVSSITSGIEDIYKAMLKYLYVAFFFLIPAIFGTFLLGDLFVNVVMGEQWLRVIPIYKTVSLLMLVFVMYTFCRTLMLLTDELKIITFADILSIVVMFLILAPDFIDSLELLAIGRVAIGLAFASILLTITLYRNKLNPWPIINLIVVQTLICIPFTLTVLFTRQFTSSLDQWLQLVLGVIVGCVFYLLTLLLLKNTLPNTNEYYRFTYEFIDNILAKARSVLTFLPSIK